MTSFGVDEAGKGPVFGSMFAAAVCVDDPAVLPEGIADSKRLSPTRRESLAATLREDDRIRIGVSEIPPARIDDPATDMNGLAVAAHAEAIDSALSREERGFESESGVADADDLQAETETSIEGLCDACDTDAARFARRVADACTADVTVDARHGADDDSPIVGAASIVAKVERDAHVAAIADTYGDVGSGYPSDPTTREFLEEYVAANGELPPFARESWSTCTDVLASATQTGLGDF
ncbi:ribonuclease HII [Halobacteria archaeon AArc-m2/3/4]|uniref:Ribonuclease HII n=1 Tax=Natronoglomus mannanivorans TaxID=2979990 RepID=A0AAP2YWK3_9EURY|nr:ribonuclease HII [Halobacteria archaeon AArc-xg1-1]MCU4972697.1 ribonuclease HII [Halobacteria archaeon AArc-m2/3/4]